MIKFYSINIYFMYSEHFGKLVHIYKSVNEF